MNLGEYIVQLVGETPSHIIAPAIHKSREAVGRLFKDKLGIPYTDDPPTLTQWNPVEQTEGITHCMTFITGPSKTADIEATLVHGAHGPRELYIFVLTG